MPNRFAKDQPTLYVRNLTSCSRDLGLPVSYYPIDGGVFPESCKINAQLHCDKVMCIAPEHPWIMCLVSFQPSLRNERLGYLTQRAWTLLAHEAVTKRGFPAGFVFVEHADRPANDYKPYATLERVVTNYFKFGVQPDKNIKLLIEPNDTTIVNVEFLSQLEHGNFASSIATSLLHKPKELEKKKLNDNISLFSKIIDAGSKTPITPKQNFVVTLEPCTPQF